MLFILLLAAFSSPAIGTNSPWFARAWQSDEGLPENNVTGVAQTPDGYLWVATPSGLARFDGVRFEEYAHTNFPGVPNRFVRALAKSRAGGLWLAMGRGPVVSVAEGVARVFTAADGLPDLVALTVTEGADGTVWLTYLGGAICRLQAGRAALLGNDAGLPAGPVCALTVDARGVTWLARGGQLGVFAENRFQPLQAIGSAPTRLAARRAGGVWVCSGFRLRWCDDAGKLTEVGELHPERPGAEPTVLFEDRAGGVWIGTSASGLFRWSGTEFSRVATTHHEILNLTEDREGNLWVGTGGGGLDRIRPRALELEGAAAGLPFEAVQSLCEDAAGTLWAATQNGLLVRRSAAGWSTFPTNLTGATCVAAGASGEVWIGTREGAVHRWQDGRLTTWSGRNGLAGEIMRAFLVDRTGDLWIGQEVANEQPRLVQRLRAGQLQSLVLPPDTRSVRAIVQDATGTVWLATSKGLLLRATSDGFADETARTGSTLFSIRCLHATPDGSLWIGYAGWGVGRLKDGRFARVRETHGLADDYISQIVADDRGWLWFGANHGLFKVRQAELDAVAEGRATRVRSILYGQSEGLPSLQANYGWSPSAIRSRDGRLWFPMRTALAVVTPGNLRENPAPPPVLIERVLTDGGVVAWHGGVLPASEEGGRKLTDPGAVGAVLALPPDHRKLEVEFTALSFVAPENVRFRHHLEGWEEDWQEAGAERRVSYPRLAAGNYSFQVQACNNDGVWNETGASLAITVAPFVWQTWWFRLAVLGLFTGGVAALVRYVSFRSLRLKLRTAQQQAALYQERARIAKDIHDDLGGSLTQISLLSELARQDRHAPEKTAAHAARISETARQVIKSLDEIVWAVNPRNDTLPHLIDYTGQFAVEFLRAAGIRCHVDLPDHPPPRAVPAEVRHNLFLAIKEALNNVVRHAQASEVWLQAVSTDASLEVVLEDNGRGFDRAPDDATADGLRNLRQRMEEIGGQFQIARRDGGGTRLELTVPWTREG